MTEARRPSGRGLVAETRTAIERLRHERLQAKPSPTVSASLAPPSAPALHGLGLGRLDNLTVKPPVIRYEREKPGDHIHIDGPPRSAAHSRSRRHRGLHDKIRKTQSGWKSK